MPRLNAIPYQPAPAGPARPATLHTLREAWLDAAVEILRPRYADLNAPLPDRIAVSCGFPGGSGAHYNVIGQCWHPIASADHRTQIFVSPILDDAVRVLDVLEHELVHAAVGTAAGHKGEFKRVAVGIGLTGPMTATVASPELAEFNARIVDRLGPYPHGRLMPGMPTLPLPPGAPIPSPMPPGRCPGGRKPQRGRLRLWICSCAVPVKVRVASDDFRATCDRCAAPFRRG